MTTYVSGESIEISYNSIGLLLEGFVKSVGIQEELIPSPAALLLPSSGNQSFRNSSEASGGIMRVSFTRQAIQYSVETRARAIIFSIGAFGGDRTLYRRPSSLTPPRGSSSDQLQRSCSKEHRGLMSWPESIYRAKQEEEINRKTLSLSERAMQLSIFGSMVNLYRRSASFSGIYNNKAQENFSYKRLPLNSAQGLVSAKSEGSIATNKQLETRKFVSQLPAQIASAGSSNRRLTIVQSSDDDDEDEGIVVRVDSPSTLVFRDDP
jgi:hypothetical protein